MTSPSENTQVQQPVTSDKELNFRKQQQMYERALAEEKAKRLELEQKLQQSQILSRDEDEDDSEPYVDHRKLEKKLAKFGEINKKQTQSEIQQAVQFAIQQERQQGWLKSNADFYDVMQHADKLAQRDPELAETILAMPEGFDRQKLVYKNIKALNLHMPEQKMPSIQEKVDANRRSPYYQPSGVGTSPYASQGDFSASGQKNAYDKLKQLQANLRLG